MTKSEFIETSKQLGFDKFKDLVVALGYHEKTIDRYKQDEQISKKIEQSLINIKNGKSTTKEIKKKTQNKKSTTKTTTKKKNKMLKKIHKKIKLVHQKKIKKNK